MLFFALAAVAAVHLGILAGPHAPFAEGRLVDADAYMRVVRVLELRLGGGWFDTVTPALAAPEGLSLHWTRPLDLLILLPALALEGLAGFDPREAIFLVGGLVSPALHVLAAVAAAWAARGLWPGAAPWFAVPMAVAMPAATGYAMPGRADHHALILLALLVALGGAVRALRPDFPRRAAVLAGAAFGFGIWVSPEALILAAPVLLATGLAVVAADDGRGLARQGMRIALAMGATLALAVVVERPPAGWLAVEYDRVSVHHVALAAAIAAVFAAVLPFADTARARRVAVGAASAVAALAVLLLLFPDALAGSFGSADAASRDVLLPAIEEMQPLPPFGRGRASDVPALLGGPPLAGLIALGLAAPGWLRDRRWPAGLALFAALLSGLVAAFAARRFALDLAAPAAVAGAGLVGAVLGAAWPRSKVFRGMAAALLLSGLLALPFAAMPGPDAAGAAAGHAEAACDVTALARWLAAERPGVAPGSPAPILMAADINAGPEIAWRTPFRAVAGPYHRGGAALQDTRAVFAATDPEAARQVLRRRGVALVLTCAGPDARMAGEGTLAARLRDGRGPGWLVPVPLPEALGGFRLLAVAPQP
ncbi:hypothetical protein [Neoroseomonas soli]|uniref:Uncharacterized protein n=1 Tax=Neoroseomonas soli TaxID=1081025 RepID=A0A9X9X0Y1_9PROT|nr:hypothetical protein [Neoroseomonas soli]MBR0673060.1 hypothetical protein [Neoroseomonas soli]